MTTCIHFLSIPDHEDRFSSISLPMVRDYAQRIGATLNLITKRTFPDFPIQYEAMQIFEAGASFDWNMYIAAGILLGETLPDPSTYTRPDHVATTMIFSARSEFQTDGNIYFERDERDLGVSDSIFLSHNLTHEVWRPLEEGFNRLTNVIKDGAHHKISSYAISHNIAKYRFKLTGLFPSQSQVDFVSPETLGARSVEEYVSTTVKRWRSESSHRGT
jgi:hypothetical protein